MIKQYVLSIFMGCTFAGMTVTQAANVPGTQQAFVTPDDLSAEVARRVLGFGGFFLDQNGTRFNIHLLEPRTKDAAIAAIAQVYGAAFFEDTGLQYPPREVRVLIGQYDYEELVEWNVRTRDLLSLPGISLKEALNKSILDFSEHGRRKV